MQINSQANASSIIPRRSATKNNKNRNTNSLTSPASLHKSTPMASSTPILELSSETKKAHQKRMDSMPEPYIPENATPEEAAKIRNKWRSTITVGIYTLEELYIDPDKFRIQEVKKYLLANTPKREAGIFVELPQAGTTPAPLTQNKINKLSDGLILGVVLPASQGVQNLFNLLLSSNNPQDFERNFPRENITLVETVTARDTAMFLYNAINATQTMASATVEQRAMKREAALRMAQHIASTYLGENNGAAFLDEIKRQIKQDTKREFGYIREGNNKISPSELFRRSVNLDNLDTANRTYWENRIDRFEREHKAHVEAINNIINNASLHFNFIINNANFSNINQWFNGMHALIGTLFS